jgi:hypothetical protein
MSRMFDPDDFEFYQPKRDPKIVVAENMARLRIATPKFERVVTMDDATRERLHAYDEAKGFIDVGGRWLISPTFAKMMHYHPPALHNSDQPEGGKNEGDPEGYEGMIHG